MTPKQVVSFALRAIVATALLALPFIVLAQAVTIPGAGGSLTAPQNTWHGIDLTQVVVALIGLVGTAIVWLQKRATDSKVKADTEAAALSRRQRAEARLMFIGASLLSRAWGELSAWGRVALADGKVSADEREELEIVVKRLIADFTSQDDLEEIAEALELPLPGIIARVVEFLIGKFTSAHDPLVATESRYTYPVSDEDRAEAEAEEQAEIERYRTSGG